MGNSKIPAGNNGCHPGIPQSTVFVPPVVRPPEVQVDYNKVSNKPSINGVTLQGDKTTDELGIDTLDPSDFATNDDIDGMFA